MNVIPNPYKTMESGSHSILGLPDQKGGENSSNILKGGAERIIPIYRQMKNSPYVSNEQKRSQRERYNEDHPEEARAEKEERYGNGNRERTERTYEEPARPHFSLTKPLFKFEVAPELIPKPQQPYPKAQPDQIVKNYILPPPGEAINQNQTYSIPNQIGQNPEAKVISQNTYNINLVIDPIDE
jgi:hypothetical protein